MADSDNEGFPDVVKAVQYLRRLKRDLVRPAHEPDVEPPAQRIEDPEIVSAREMRSLFDGVESVPYSKLEPIVLRVRVLNRRQLRALKRLLCRNPSQHASAPSAADNSGYIALPVHLQDSAPDLFQVEAQAQAQDQAQVQDLENGRDLLVFKDAYNNSILWLNGPISWPNKLTCAAYIVHLSYCHGVIAPADARARLMSFPFVGAFLLFIPAPARDPRLGARNVSAALAQFISSAPGTVRVVVGALLNVPGSARGERDMPLCIYCESDVAIRPDGKMMVGEWVPQRGALDLPPETPPCAPGVYERWEDVLAASPQLLYGMKAD